MRFQLFPGGIVLQRKACGNLRHDQILAIAQGNIVHILFQVVHRAVPEGIIAQTDIIKVHSAAGKEAIKPGAVQLVIAAVVQMEHDLRTGCSIPNRTDTRIQKQRNIFKIGNPAIGPQQPFGKLVTHCHNGGKQSLSGQRAQHTVSKVINRLGQPLWL